MGDEESAAASGAGQQSRRRVAGVAVTLCVALLVAALATLLWLRPLSASVPLVSTAGWQTYSDPQQLFSLTVPSDWSIQQSQEPGDIFGNRDGSYSYTGEDVWLGVPPQTADGLGVWVNVVPLTTDFARKWDCQAYPPGPGLLSSRNATLGGVPASYDNGDTWLIEAHDAHFQINAHYPGGPESPHTEPAMQTLPPTPTPVPADQLAANKQIIDTVLASFTLTNPTPLGC